MKKRTNDVLLQFFEQTLSEELTLQELLQAAANAFAKLLHTNAVYFFTEKGAWLPPAGAAGELRPRPAETVPKEDAPDSAKKARTGGWPAAPPERALLKKIETCMAKKAGRSVCVYKKDAEGSACWLFWLKARQAVCGAAVCVTPAALKKDALSGASRLANCIAPRFAALTKAHEAQPLSVLSEDTAVMLSHEFKTPLTGALTSLQLLRRRLQEEGRDIPENAEKYLDYAELNLYKALRLAINLVDAQYARPDGRFARPEPIDLVKALAELAESVRPYAEIAGVRLVLENRVGGTCRTVCDGFCLERILLNLLSNAFRHAPQSSFVRMVLEQSEQGTQIHVEDEGAGIPEEAREDLFQKFWHGPGERTGTGLGLYLSRRFAEEMGGTLRAENRPQGGARFTLCLPRAGKGAPSPAGNVLQGAAAAYRVDSRDTLLRIEFSELLSQKCN